MPVPCLFRTGRLGSQLPGETARSDEQLSRKWNYRHTVHKTYMQSFLPLQLDVTNGAQTPQKKMKGFKSSFATGYQKNVVLEFHTKQQLLCFWGKLRNVSRWLVHRPSVCVYASAVGPAYRVCLLGSASLMFSFPEKTTEESGAVAFPRSAAKTFFISTVYFSVASSRGGGEARTAYWPVAYSKNFVYFVICALSRQFRSLLGGRRLCFCSDATELTSLVVVGFLFFFARLN